jgi:hypothetical protein
MASPRRTDDLTRVAEYLAQQRAEASGRKVPRRLFKNTPEGLETAELGDDQWVTVGRRKDDERPGLQAEGYEWAAGDEYDRALAAHQQPPIDMKGRLPFISGAPVHPSRANPSATLPEPGDPGMGNAMSQAATAWRKHGAQQSEQPPAPAVAKKSGSAGMKRSLQVSTTSQSGPQPQLREFQPLAQLAPKELEMRLGGLPEGVAREMRKRWGLGDAQADANNRSLAVELASAGNQIGSGIAGGKYDDGLWDNQRRAARQPVADYEAQAGEERQQNEDQRRAAEDEREARAAEQAAEMELRKFEYGQRRDQGQDQLARDRMAQDADLAAQRLRSEGLDRGMRREEMTFRQAEAAEAKKEAARLKREDMLGRQGERDQQELAKRLQAAADAKPDLDLVMRYATGSEDEDIPGVGWGISGLPGAMVSQDGSDLRQAAIRLYRAKTRIESGQTVTPQEAQTALEARGMGAWKTEGQWRSGMKALANETASAMRNIESGFNEDVVQERSRRGGVTSRDIPVAPTRHRVIGPNGESGTLEDDELDMALMNGWRLADG